jgi:hypothetical protein
MHHFPHYFSSIYNNTTTMAKKDTVAHEKRIEDAIEAFIQGEHALIRAAAKEYKVSHSTLSRRIRGRKSRTARIPVNKGLTHIQEGVLLEWIKYLNDHGFSPTKNMVVAYANKLRTREDQGFHHFLGSGVLGGSRHRNTKEGRERARETAKARRKDTGNSLISRV